MRGGSRSAASSGGAVLEERIRVLEHHLSTQIGDNSEITQHFNELKQQLAADVERRDRILRGVNTASTRLIRSVDWRTDISDILRILAEATNADRAGLFQIWFDDDQCAFANLLYGWDHADPEITNNPRFHNIDLAAWGFGPMLDAFQEARPYYVHRSERPPDGFVAPDNQTSLNIPIFVNGSLWGLLNVSVTRHEYDWMPAELDVLQIAASILGATIERAAAEDAVRERDRLQNALEHEQELSHTKLHIMRTISHEFRTPLAIILSSSTLLMNYYDRMNSNTQHEKLTVIQQQVEQLEYLIERVADALRESNDPLHFRPGTCNLELICQLHLAEAQAKLGEQRQLRFITDGTLTEAFVDEYLVHRILTNLLSNAVKYSFEGSEIQLRLRTDGGHAVIEIEDHGIGISLKGQTRLFEQFYRATNAENIGGIGLGLSIVRESVEQHHGKISVRSEIDRGTTFTVRLPLRPVDAA